MSAIPKHMFWTYGPEFAKRNYLSDPRMALAKHIGWKKFHYPDTEFKTPEPDNYNRAILAKYPYDCTVIEDQVFYYDKDTKGWITLMYVPDNLVGAVDSWIYQCKPWAVWCHQRAPKIKPQRSLLWVRSNICEDNQTDNERLYTMGYFDDLKVKYFSDDTEYVDSLLGEARASLKNPLPEEEELDEF